MGHCAMSTNYDSVLHTLIVSIVLRIKSVFAIHINSVLQVFEFYGPTKYTMHKYSRKCDMSWT